MSTQLDRIKNKTATKSSKFKSKEKEYFSIGDRGNIIISEGKIEGSIVNEFQQLDNSIELDFC